MNFYNNLYKNENITETKIKNIVSLLKQNISVYDIYLICINKNNKNLLIIINSKEIFKAINNLQDSIVIGISDSKNNAFLLVKEIISDYYSINKNFNNFKNYFLKNSE